MGESALDIHCTTMIIDIVEFQTLYPCPTQSYHVFRWLIVCRRSKSLFWPEIKAQCGAPVEIYLGASRWTAQVVDLQDEDTYDEDEDILTWIGSLLSLNCSSLLFWVEKILEQYNLCSPPVSGTYRTTKRTQTTVYWGDITTPRLKGG